LAQRRAQKYPPFTSWSRQTTDEVVATAVRSELGGIEMIRTLRPMEQQDFSAGETLGKAVD
jgi:hypothetical protein